MRRLRPLTGLTLPISAGTPVGVEEATVDGRVIETVPVVAAASVAGVLPEPLQAARADARAAALLARILVVLLRALGGAFL